MNHAKLIKYGVESITRDRVGMKYQDFFEVHDQVRCLYINFDFLHKDVVTNDVVNKSQYYFN